MFLCVDREVKCLNVVISIVAQISISVHPIWYFQLKFVYLTSTFLLTMVDFGYCFACFFIFIYTVHIDTHLMTPPSFQSLDSHRVLVLFGLLSIYRCLYPFGFFPCLFLCLCQCILRYLQLLNLCFFLCTKLCNLIVSLRHLHIFAWYNTLPILRRAC